MIFYQYWIIMWMHNAVHDCNCTCHAIPTIFILLNKTCSSNLDNTTHDINLNISKRKYNNEMMYKLFINMPVKHEHKRALIYNGSTYSEGAEVFLNLLYLLVQLLFSCDSEGLVLCCKLNTQIQLIS